METRVITLGTWIRRYEGWRRHPNGTWQSAGRALTRAGARRKAEALPARRGMVDFSIVCADNATPVLRDAQAALDRLA